MDKLASSGATYDARKHPDIKLRIWVIGRAAANSLSLSRNDLSTVEERMTLASGDAYYKAITRLSPYSCIVNLKNLISSPAECNRKPVSEIGFIYTRLINTMSRILMAIPLEMEGNPHGRRSQTALIRRFDDGCASNGVMRGITRSRQSPRRRQDNWPRSSRRSIALMSGWLWRTSFYI